MDSTKQLMKNKTKYCCNTQLEITKCSFLWTIDNFSYYDTKKIGFDLVSSTFKSDANDMTWNLMIYPKGFNDDCKDDVSIYLKLNSSDNKGIVEAEYNYSLLNVNKENTIKKVYRNEFSVNKSQGNNVIKRALLFDTAKGFLPKNQLTIYCKVTVYGKPINVTEVNKLIISNPEIKISNVFGHLFESKKFSDVIININGHEYSAHKLILSVHSPVFAAMFESEMEENIQNRIEISDMNHEVAYEMLRYIYSGKVSKLNQMAYDLFIAADKYDLKQLKIMCENYLRTHLCIETAADVLILSDMHSARELKEIVIQYVRKNISEIGKTKGWGRMAIKHPELVASLYSDLNC